MLIKNIWRRLTCSLVALLLLISLYPIETQAKTVWPAAPEVGSPSAIVMELNSGAVLYEKNSQEVNYPASITKIMTTMLALEHCDLDEVVTFSADAVFKNEGNTSHIARDLGEKMTMEECLYAVMLESANECAYAVAEHVGAKLGGNYQTFVDLMNEKAKALGCTNTHFNNANGLPDEDHWTSAKDMMLISREAFKYEQFRIIINTRRYVIPPTNKHSESTYLNNHHEMIHNYKTDQYLYKYALGGKTGYTQAAGATLVSYAEKDGMTLVCVVMRTSKAHYYADTKNLFEYCFQNFVNHNILVNEERLMQKDESKGFMNNAGAFVSLDENACITLPITASFSDAKCTLTHGDKDSGKVAQLVYTYDDVEVGSTAIVPTGTSVKDHYLKDKVQKPEGDKEIVKIKPLHIVMVVVALIASAVLIFLIKKLYDNFYLILHNIDIRRKKRRKFHSKSGRRRRF